MLFSYKNCEFQINVINSTDSEIIVESVKGSVLEIPETYEGKSITVVGIEQHAKNFDWQYFKPTSDKFEFYSVEEIRIPKSVTSIVINRMLFPSLSYVLLYFRRILFVIPLSLFCIQSGWELLMVQLW